MLSARSALAIVFGANLGAISGVKIALIRLARGPNRPLFYDFALRPLSNLCFPQRAWIVFLRKICNFAKRRVYAAVKRQRKQ